MDKTISPESTIKSILLQCIEDAEILEALRSAIYNSPAKGLADSQKNGEDTDIEEINAIADRSCLKRIEDKIDSLTKLQKEMMDIIQVQSLKEKKKAFKSENEILKEKKDAYQDFEKAAAVWEGLNSLNEDAKDYITKLCGSFDLSSCLSLGRDAGKTRQLWNYLKEEAVKADPGNIDMEKLNLYFDFCLQTANAINANGGCFESFELPIGSEFDMDKCIKTSGSRQIGAIQKTIVKGYKRNDTVVYKAIVKIG